MNNSKRLAVPELDFSAYPQLVITSAEGDIRYPQLAERIEQRAGELSTQGVTLQDILLLPMNRQVDDVVNLLAAIQVAGATLLYPSITTPAGLNKLQAHATMRLDNLMQGKVIRLQSPQEKLQPTDDALLGVLSSGSTGEPKRIWHRFSHFIHSARASNQLLTLPASGYSLASLPLHHVGGLGLVFRALLNRSALLFDVPPDDLASYQNHDIQRASLVPTQLHRLLVQRNAPLSTQFLLGGGPITAILLRQARDLGWRIHRSYGLSEMASQVVTEVSDNHWQCLPHAELRIERDEILVRGQSLFLGYGDAWQPYKPTQNDWFATNDLGHWSVDRLTIKGRKDNQFISGGENVHPEAIEQAFINTGLVQQIVVLPKQHGEWGAQTVAMVMLTDGVTVQQLQQFSKQQLLPHQQPKHYYRWQPSTGMKVQRRSLTAKVDRNDLDKLA